MINDYQNFFISHCFFYGKCHMMYMMKDQCGICLYRSGMLNSNMVNSKFLRNLCQIPIISCLKLTVNSKMVNSK